MGRDKGLYREKIVRAAERPRQTAGCLSISERRVG